MPNAAVRNVMTVGSRSYEYAPAAYTGTLGTFLDAETIAANATTQIALTLDVSAVKAFAILATVNCTFKTNDNTSPNNTLSLVANTAYLWPAFTGHTNPLNTDVATVFVTNAGAAGTLTVDVVSDATP